MARNKKKKSNKKGNKPFVRQSYKKNAKKGNKQSQATAQQSTAENIPQATTRTNQTKQKIENLPTEPAPTLGIKEGKATLVFQASDTLFFRESRPMESMGELQSTFPPSSRTLTGAVRSFIGDSKNVDWKAFDKDHTLCQHIGFGDDLGPLTFQGAWLAWQGERLYPTPQLLLQKTNTHNKEQNEKQNEKHNQKIYRLALADKGTHCDLGKNVRLPCLPEGAQGSKPLENTWLTQAGLEAVLKGNRPDQHMIKTANDLFTAESRVGIARDNTSRTVEKGMLYQTEHIRPHHGLTIELDVQGLDDTLPTSAIIRLGGEARSASVSLQQKEALLPALPNINTQTQAQIEGIILYLLTPLKYTQTEDKWQPLPGFVKQESEQNQPTIWVGTLNGIELELHSAVTGKSIRDGGWDLAKHQPRTAHSMIPAGSAFFCTVKNGDHQTTITTLTTLHNTHIGDMTEYGLGHLVAGLWLKHS